MAFVRVRNRETGQQKVLSSGMAHSLRDKYEIITEGVTESEGSQTTEEFKSEVVPNVEAAVEKKTADANEEGAELAVARAEYEKAFGEKPHGRLKIETLKKLTAEKNGQA